MYYTNISNSELQYFHNLPVSNFTIRLTDLLTSGLFRVDEVIEGSIYKIYPLYHTPLFLSTSEAIDILILIYISCFTECKNLFKERIKNI